jgi:hypothetical protein
MSQATDPRCNYKTMQMTPQPKQNLNLQQRHSQQDTIVDMGAYFSQKVVRIAQNPVSLTKELPLI